MNENTNLVELMNLDWGSIVWPLVVLCAALSASLVANFSHLKRWMGRVARGAFILWLVMLVNQLLIWYLYTPDQFQYMFRPAFYAWTEIRHLFVEGLPAALLWCAVGVGAGIMVDHIYRDLCHYLVVAWKSVKVLGSLKRLLHWVAEKIAITD